ncbi:ABC transporter permease [Acetobacter okinawensis]|uniref:ABC transporter permease n=1 Tax=Acetobacter okinawensis TaxID=1076594 RepID=UPI001BA8C39C|nr:ABC transporter permease [Acetobacter okinawensis]MBS0987212.1 ABC transporter permease [Acetobacter okinawensis]
MIRYLFTRFLHAIFVLWGAFTLSFVLLQVMPGDAVLVKFQDPELGLSPQQIADMRATYGADESAITQYAHVLGRTLHGNLGYSIETGLPVGQMLHAAYPTTLRLAIVSFTGALALAAICCALAILFSGNPIGRYLAAAIGAIPGITSGIPVFWLEIVAIQLVSFHWKLIPVVGLSGWSAVLLPGLALAIPISAPLAQVFLAAAHRVEALPFIDVLRARGVSPFRILYAHILPNALPPTLTVSGLVFGEILAGAVVTETVFGLDGLGQLAQQAVASQDVAVLQAIILISVSGFVSIGFASEIIQPLLDPRIGRNARQRKY